MTRIRPQLPAVLSSLIAAILVSSGIVFAQVPVDRTIIPRPPEPMLSGIPQDDNELPSFNAQEMADEDRDDLLRGPVHEAFAEQVNSDPRPNMIITLQPPEPVEELPPELKPDGRLVEWISGYWAWDEDHNDFIWVSGIWREIPQGFRWLPGYWTKLDGGFQWVSGTWVSTQTSEIEYRVDAPPETLELGAIGNAPTEDHIWIPGTWLWNDSRYAWRPGYWSIGHANWLWVPSRYQWTPRGYYHCQGYWDYPINRRGVLFAPSYFNPRFRNVRITRFTPQIVVSTNLLTTHFWVRPQCRHYYFGNYYNVAYSNRGLMPWHQFPQQRRACDPLFAYYSRGQRSNGYYNQLNNQFHAFVSQPNRRPPITFRDQDRWQQDGRGIVRQMDLLGNRFQNVVDNSAHDHSGTQFVRMENRQREQVQQETRQQRELGNQRRDVEQSLTQLQRHRDEPLDQDADENVAGRVDQRDRLDRHNRLDRHSSSRVSREEEPGSVPGNNAVKNGGDTATRNPVTLEGKSKDSPTFGDDVEAKTRDHKDGDPNDREVKAGDVAANALKLAPKVDAVNDGPLRNQIENTARDASRIGREAPIGVGQKSRTTQKQSVKDRSADLTKDATARQTERAESKQRLQLPPVSRVVDTQPSSAASNSGKSAPVNTLRRDATNRTESRSNSGSQARASNTLRNGSAIRNNNQGAVRTPTQGGPVANPPAIERDVTPSAERLPRPESTLRSTPNPRPAHSERSNAAHSERSNAAHSERSMSAPNPGVGQGTGRHSGAAQRPSPSITAPRSSGGGARSTPGPATSPARPSGGAAGGGKAGRGDGGGGRSGSGRGGGGNGGNGKKGAAK